MTMNEADTVEAVRLLRQLQAAAPPTWRVFAEPLSTGWSVFVCDDRDRTIAYACEPSLLGAVRNAIRQTEAMRSIAVAPPVPAADPPPVRFREFL